MIYDEEPNQDILSDTLKTLIDLKYRLMREEIDNKKKEVILNHLNEALNIIKTSINKDRVHIHKGRKIRPIYTNPNKKQKI